MEWNIYLIWVAVTSALLFFLYGLDKSRAVKGGQRVPERTLHLIALLGGFPGGWLGRSVFRHKTRKDIFFFVLAAATILHAALWWWIFFG